MDIIGKVVCMSRETKFRAWDKENGYYADYEDIEEEITAQAIDGWRSEDGGTSFTLDYGIKDFELEQYTWLTDKNGKEIYVGDIVKCWDENCGEVYFDTISLQYRVKFSDGDDEDLAGSEPEVIGTIHENPELLEAGK